MTTSHGFTVEIEPVPTPRLRFRRIGKGVSTYYPGSYTKYLEAVADAYAGPDFGEVPLYVEIKVSLPRPKSHYGTGKNQHKVKDSAPEKPTTRADVDNYAKGVLDALTGVAYADDKQVVQLSTEKRWGAPFVQVFIQEHE